MIDFENSSYSKKAVELFKSGYNCSQSVFCAFAEDFDIDFNTALSLSSGFGGGMGRLRETCGAITGGIMVLGLKFGYNNADDYDKKAELYNAVQSFVSDFKSELGSSDCSELLKTTDNNPLPTKRTEDFYLNRPCAKFVAIGAYLVEKLIS